MTTKHIPLCQTKGCPHPNDPDWHRCFVCGKEPIDHQHYKKKSLAGKGAKIVAALCRYHHERITLHEWREGVYVHPDGSKRYYVQNQKGEEMCERIIEAAPTAVTTSTPSAAPVLFPEPIIPGFKETPSAAPVDTSKARLPVLDARKPGVSLDAVPDEQLAALFAEADKRQAEGFLLKCRIVHTYRERHVQAWGSSWVEQAYELFHVSRRTLFAYANIHGISVRCDTYLTEAIGPLTDSRSLMQFIGRKSIEEGRAALEAAVAHVAEFGEPPTIAGLQHKLDEEAKPPEPCAISEDGMHEGRKREEGEEIECNVSPTGKHVWICAHCNKRA